MTTPIKSVLVVEDEENIAEIVRRYLEREGFSVTTCLTAQECFEAVERLGPQLVILDIGLPDVDGVEVCKRLRASHSIPVIMLTARDSEVDRVVGLEVGADDYITKPFSPRELVARVKAVLRRTHPEPQVERVQIGEIVVDRGRQEVRKGNQVIELTAKEFELLWYFCINRGLVLSREQIIRAVWGYEYLGESRTIDVHVRQLRRKLGEEFPLKTRWGVGYQLRV
ncbi:MAG: DNA-binding response regulator [Acidimicrobiia bacterium]